MLSWKQKQKKNNKKVIKKFSKVFNFFSIININQIWTQLLTDSSNIWFCFKHTKFLLSVTLAVGNKFQGRYEMENILSCT